MFVFGVMLEPALCSSPCMIAQVHYIGTREDVDSLVVYFQEAQTLHGTRNKIKSSFYFLTLKRQIELR